MRKTKRLLALLLTLVLVSGMTVLTYAGPVEDAGAMAADDMTPEPNGAEDTDRIAPAKAYVGGRPQPTDRTTAAVVNVASGAAVTAYRIVEPTYGVSGFTGYQAVSGTGIVKATEPTSDEVTSIAANQWLLNTLESEPLYPDGWVDADGLTTYTGQLGAGYWLVLVTPYAGVTTEIYNPMLIGVYYSADGPGGSVGLVTGGAVNANSKWSLNSEPVYAKSEEPRIDKRITGESGKYWSDGNESGNDAAVGDTVSFAIDTQIPGYSKAYQNVRVDVTDRIGKGLTLASPAAITVKVGAVSSQAITVTSAAFTYTQDYDDKGFQISFYSDFALAHSGENVYISYDATVSGDAGYNFDANTNTAKLVYTNDPHDMYRTTEVEDTTYTYTFGIDADLCGNNPAWNQVTRELIKTGEGAAVSGSAVTAAAISGASFSLVATGSALAYPASYAAISDAEGRLTFTGLDAGDYLLQETAAPEGYSLNEAVIPVSIWASYNEDGTLSSYTVSVAGEAYSTYSAAYRINEWTNQAEVASVSSSAITYEIKNTKLNGLPSTGGIGTTIFTIAGCALMVLAAGLFFANRKKSEK